MDQAEGTPHPTKPGWTWQHVTCDQGTCYHTWAGYLPAALGDQRKEALAADPDRQAHLAAAHPQAQPELGGSSPTSWPPGSLDPARIDPDRVISTHPDGSVAETKPVIAETAPDGGPNPDPSIESPQAAAAPVDPSADTEPAEHAHKAKHEPAHHGKPHGKSHR